MLWMSGCATASSGRPPGSATEGQLVAGADTRPWYLTVSAHSEAAAGTQGEVSATSVSAIKLASLPLARSEGCQTAWRSRSKSSVDLPAESVVAHVLSLIDVIIGA